jgi:hypothetical protein
MGNHRVSGAVSAALVLLVACSGQKPAATEKPALLVSEFEMLVQPGGIRAAAIAEVPDFSGDGADRNPPGTVEVFGTAPWAIVGSVGTCPGDVISAPIRVKSYFTEELQNVHVEFTYTSQIGHEACDPDPSPDPQISEAIGVYSYGTLAGSLGTVVATGKIGPGEFDDRTWNLNYASQTPYVLRGQVWADAYPPAATLSDVTNLEPGESLTWSADVIVTGGFVQIAANESFSIVLESASVEGFQYTPTQLGAYVGQTLYWRVYNEWDPGTGARRGTLVSAADSFEMGSLASLVSPVGGAVVETQSASFVFDEAGSADAVDINVYCDTADAVNCCSDGCPNNPNIPIDTFAEALINVPSVGDRYTYSADLTDVIASGLTQFTWSVTNRYSGQAGGTTARESFLLGTQATLVAPIAGAIFAAADPSFVFDDTAPADAVDINVYCDPADAVNCCVDTCPYNPSVAIDSFAVTLSDLTPVGNQYTYEPVEITDISAANSATGLTAFRWTVTNRYGGQSGAPTASESFTFQP